MSQLAFYGLNIHSNTLSGSWDMLGGQKRELVTLLDRLRPAVCLVLNDAKGVQFLANHYPNMTVIDRIKTDAVNDDNIHNVMSPQAYYHEAVYIRQQAIGNLPNVIYSIGNELPCDQRSITFLVEVARIAVQKQTRIVLGNWSVYNPSNAAISTYATPLINIMNQYPQYLIMGGHEYLGSDVYAPTMLGVAIGRKEQWQASGLSERVQWIISESGWDGEGTRGLKEVASLWEKKGIYDYQVYGAGQLEIAYQHVYRGKNVFGACLFCYGYSEAWKTFDLQNQSILFEKIQTIAVNTPPVIVTPPPPPPPSEETPPIDWQLYLIETTMTHNVRRVPNTLYTEDIIDKIKRGSVVRADLSLPMIRGSVHQWYTIAIEQQGTWVKGYVAQLSDKYPQFIKLEVSR